VLRVNRLRLLVATLVLGLALTAAFASRGTAAGSNICPPNASPSCFGITLTPGIVNVGGSAVAILSFTNLGTAVATHTVVGASLPSGTSPVSITSNPAATCALATLSCDFGKVTGGSNVRVFVRLTVTSLVQSLTVNGSLAFGEANNNTGTPTNDTLTATSNAVQTSQSPSLVGTCSDGANHLSASTTGQFITVVYPAADPSLGLPCTPASAGIANNVLPGFTQRTTFADLPLLSGAGVATAFLDFPTIPTGFTYLTVPLFEIPPTGAPFQVQNCVGGAIPSGQDSCIKSRAPFNTNGVEFTLLVLGSGVDPSWAY
jgi:hypothetical protein